MQAPSTQHPTHRETAPVLPGEIVDTMCDIGSPAATDFDGVLTAAAARGHGI